MGRRDPGLYLRRDLLQTDPLSLISSTLTLARVSEELYPPRSPAPSDRLLSSSWLAPPGKGRST